MLTMYLREHESFTAHTDFMPPVTVKVLVDSYDNGQVFYVVHGINDERSEIFISLEEMNRRLYDESYLDWRCREMYWYNGEPSLEEYVIFINSRVDKS